MEKHIKNPHTFDINNYYTGQIFVLGGRDFEREENEYISKVVVNEPKDSKLPIKLDWSFLKNTKKKK